MPTGIYVRTKEYRTIMSNVMKGNINGFKKGQTGYNKGRKLPWVKDNPQTFKKGLIPWNKGRPHLRGEQHWNWKGGIDKEHIRVKQTTEYKTWRAAVYRRDKWQCKRCGAKKKLTAHHIKLFSQFPLLRFVVSNGITLCRSCHLIVHRKKLKQFLWVS